MASNLPPGVTDSMIPGNRPEDEAWETFHEEIDVDCDIHSLTVEEAYTAWEKGLIAIGKRPAA